MFRSIFSILPILFFWPTPLLSQVGIIEDHVQIAKIIGNKDFGLLLKERFKDSIPGLDTMIFRMRISRKGKVREVQYLHNYYAPSISKSNFIRISDFVIESISWKPALIKENNRWKKVSTWLIVFINAEVIDRIE